MAGMIDIEYETLKRAINAIEAKQGICKKLPSARFKWEYERGVGGLIQIGNHMPNIGTPDDNSHVEIELIVCDRLGGQSVGTSADICRNCTLKE